MTGITGPIVGTQATNTTSATTLAVPYPASVTSSHVMVLYVSVNSVTPATLPAGWTQVVRTASNGNTNSPGILVAIKQATGSESGNLSVTTPNVKSTGQMLAFGGVNLTTPQDVTATVVDKAAGSANMSIPSLTTTRPGCAIVYVGTMSIGADQVTLAPLGYTQDGDGVGTGGWPGTMGHKILSGAGATGTVTISWNATDKGYGVLLALRALDQGIDAAGTDGLTAAADLALTRGLDAAATAGPTAVAALGLTRGLDAAETSGSTAVAALALTRGLDAAPTMGATAVADLTVSGHGRIDLIPIRADTTANWAAAAVLAALGNTNHDIRDREILGNIDDGSLSLGDSTLTAAQTPSTVMQGPGTIATKTANYAVSATADRTIVGNGSTITITLPTPVGRPGRRFEVKNIHSTSLTVATAAATIDGGATVSLAQWAKSGFVSDGAQWLTI